MVSFLDSILGFFHQLAGGIGVLAVGIAGAGPDESFGDVDTADDPRSDSAADPGGGDKVRRLIVENARLTAELKALRASQDELVAFNRERDVILGSVSECVLHVDRDSRIVWANGAAERRFGKPVSEVIGRRCHEVRYGSNEKCPGCPTTQAMATGRIQEAEVTSKDGRNWHARAYPIRNDLQEVVGAVEVMEDVTDYRKAEEERKELERQFLHAQKMEAVGRLAGGVAHDFNNLLTVINGHAAMLLVDLEPSDDRRADVEAIADAGQSAAGLTAQLLAISRKRTVSPRNINLNRSITDAGKMLHRVLGEDIELTFEQGEGVGDILADPSQIVQVLLNLAVNARDAMPRGGTLTVRTSNATIDPAYCRRKVDWIPGHYVVLTISDTGCGMDDETQAQIFEPFFTTKNEKGTGLGLSTVYGIVRQAGGRINVYSEVGVGTTFGIYFPRVESESDFFTKSVPGVSKGGSETVLVVEDDPNVRDTVERILSLGGYSVLSASDRVEAERVFGECGETIDLLLTDLVLPGSSGKELSEAVREVAPDIRVLHMSGYTDDVVKRHGLIDRGGCFLQKPFTMDELLREVRFVLDR